jgi:thiamine monophosphate kinase
VGAVVAVDAVPGRQEYKLAAGEDYELLVAASPLEDLRDLGLTRIGQVESSGIVRFVNGRGESVNTGEGFDHFGRPSPC